MSSVELAAMQGQLAGEETGGEGKVARAIESRTSKLPSDIFLWGALLSIGSACILRVAGRKEDANFVGQWAAPILLLGVYNKIVKVSGHDKLEGQNDMDSKD